MKLQSTLAASLFAIAAALSLNASAASDTSADVKTEKVDAKAQIKPESHMEDMMGMASNDKEAKPEKSTPAKINPAFDKTRHYHPRDGGKL
jgi:hypothetical protein